MITVLLASAFLLQSPATASAEPPAWLAGCWLQQVTGGTIEEHWTAPGGGAMLGMGRTIKSGRMTAYEFLRIAVVDGRLAYVAEPSGQAAATFPLKSMTAAEVVFEDLGHDFPQRVIYRREGADRLNARVEGMIGGRERAETFAYRRCPSSAAP
jgi:hypothetical protein